MLDKLTDRRPKFAAVYHFAIGKLSPIAMAAYVVLAAHADNDRHDAWPGHAKIAEIGRMSRSSVKRALSELVEQKLISIRKVGRKGQEHNLYVLLFPASTQAKQGGMVPTDPRFSRNRGRSSENRGRSSGCMAIRMNATIKRLARPGSFQISSDIPATLAVLNARILTNRAFQSK